MLPASLLKCLNNYEIVYESKLLFTIFFFIYGYTSIKKHVAKNASLQYYTLFYISVNFAGISSSCSNVSSMGNCTDEVAAAGYKSCGGSSSVNGHNSVLAASGLASFYSPSHHHQMLTSADSMNGMTDITGASVQQQQHHGNGMQHQNQPPQHLHQTQQQQDGLSSTFGFTQEQVACVCEVCDCISCTSSLDVPIPPACTPVSRAPSPSDSTIGVAHMCVAISVKLLYETCIINLWSAAKRHF